MPGGGPACCIGRKNGCGGIAGPKFSAPHCPLSATTLPWPPSTVPLVLIEMVVLEPERVVCGMDDGAALSP